MKKSVKTIIRLSFMAIIGLLLLPFRYVFSFGSLVLIVFFSLIYAIVVSISEKSWRPWIEFFKVVWEGFLNALIFGIWPIVKLFKPGKKWDKKNF